VGSSGRVGPSGRVGSSGAAGLRPRVVGIREARDRNGHDLKARFRIEGRAGRGRLGRGREGPAPVGSVQEGLAPAASAPMGPAPAGSAPKGRVPTWKAAKEAGSTVRTAPAPPGVSGGPTTRGLPGPRGTVPVAADSGPVSVRDCGSARVRDRASARDTARAATGSNRSTKASSRLTQPESLDPGSVRARAPVVSRAPEDRVPPGRRRGSPLGPTSALNPVGGPVSDSAPTGRRNPSLAPSPTRPPISMSPGSREWPTTSSAPPTPPSTRRSRPMPTSLGTMARLPRGRSAPHRAQTTALVPAASSIAGPSRPPARPARRGLGHPWFCPPAPF
jgi:hypothetical protein